MTDYFTNIGDIATFHQERPLEFFRNGDRVVILGDDSFTIKQSGVTARGEYALVFDLRDGLITRFLIIQDLSAFLDAYRNAEHKRPDGPLRHTHGEADPRGRPGRGSRGRP